MSIEVNKNFVRQCKTSRKDKQEYIIDENAENENVVKETNTNDINTNNDIKMKEENTFSKKEENKEDVNNIIHFNVLFNTILI